MQSTTARAVALALAVAALATGAVTANAAAAVHRLTTAQGFDGESSFSLDGRRIVFTSERREYATLAAYGVAPFAHDAVVMNRDGSNQVNITCPTTNPSCSDPTIAGPLITAAEWPQWTLDGSGIVADMVVEVMVGGKNPKAEAERAQKRAEELLTQLGHKRWA
jgi:Tol biopolymer transport system component